jgi:hypothetical protein
VAKILPALRDHGLVSDLGNKRWAAIEPPEDKRGWFLLVKKSNTSTWLWHKRFGGYWCYITAYLGKGSMSPRQSAIFWKIHNWEQGGLAPVKKSWRTQTLIPYRTVLHTIRRLQEMGLIDSFGKVTLDEDQHKYWQDKPPTKKLTATTTLREWFLDWWDDRKPEFFGSIEDLGNRLDLYESQMLAAGYSQRDILDYFGTLTKCLDDYFDPIEKFLQMGFWELFKQVEQIHAKEGTKYPNSLGLLKYMTRSVRSHLLQSMHQDELYAWVLPSLKK